jgi:hypothetical protein
MEDDQKLHGSLVGNKNHPARANPKRYDNLLQDNTPPEKATMSSKFFSGIGLIPTGLFGGTFFSILVFSAPSTASMAIGGIIGGCLALRTVKNQSPWSYKGKIARGVVCGALAGLAFVAAARMTVTNMATTVPTKSVAPQKGSTLIPCRYQLDVLKLRYRITIPNGDPALS